jgi:glutathione S-transferase
MIELLQFHPTLGLMNASPFCMKVEVFLRLAGLEYRTVDASPVRSPKGKLPVLRDEGHTIADSEAIIAHLQRRYADRLPPALAAPETPAQHLLRRTLEEHTYFAALHWRWVEDVGWQHTQRFFARLPWGARQAVGALVRRKIRRDLHGQGIGRHTREDLCARAAADIDAIAQSLGDAPFFGGAEPATIDACVYAFLANLVWVPIDTPIRRHGLASAPLMAYGERMRARVGA